MSKAIPGTSIVVKLPPLNKKTWILSGTSPKMPTIWPVLLIPSALVKALSGTSIVVSAPTYTTASTSTGIHEAAQSGRVVDAKGLGEATARDLDRGEATPTQQKTLGGTNIREDAHNLAGIVDPEGLGGATAGDLDRGEAAPT